MLNNENADHVAHDHVDNVEVPPLTEPVQVPGIDLPGQQPAKQPRNQHLKVDEPKNISFTARATNTEAARIKRALERNGKADIVRLMLYAIDLLENDILTTFKS